jgi:polar amino acid transport system permease protein
MIAVSALFGVLLGCVLSWMTTQHHKTQKTMASLYIEVMRNTPFIVQLFFIFFALPSLGLKLSPLQASMLAMSINLSAYSAEILRAGIESIAIGQLQAAKSLALNPLQTFISIVLPQAFKNTWPALVSQIVIVMLGSSVCAQISTEELSYAANLIQSRNFRAFESFFIATLAYLLLSLLVRLFLDKVVAKFIFKGPRG